MKKHNQSQNFRSDQSTFQCFSRLMYDGKQELFAFRQSLSTGFLIEFVGLQNQQSRSDKILFFDHLRTKTNKQTIRVNGERYKLHVDALKLIPSQQ